MLLIPRELLKLVADAAEAAYPAECCGLLIGTGTRHPRVTRIEPSPNLAAGRNDRFEVDPALRLKIMRELRDGPERLIGHYHSHPDHPAEPSATDLAMAFEPELIWLIAAVQAGQAIQVSAHRPDPVGKRFHPVRLRTF
jgi:proteasome lid subunit RPN8/RPN11